MIKNRLFRKYAAIFAFIISAAFLLEACTEKEEPDIPVTSVTLNQPTAILLVGKLLTLEATIEPAEATNKTVTWRTDDDRIATINSEGVVTAIAPGMATIMASADDGRVTETCTITVYETGITMTTMAFEVCLSIEITSGTNNYGYLAIDWGDGTISKSIDAAYSNGYGSFGFSHIYSGAFDHHITIAVDNIEYLYCSYNQLTTLNVSDAISLKYLDCYWNQLTSLDVSKNTALTDLYCFDNRLAVLDLSRNLALTSLWCDNNTLTDLDVSKNKVLNDFRCDNNQLTTLDVSKNIVLNGLFCSRNQLTALDVSQNTALTSLWCGYNQLTVLDVDRNTALIGLDVCNNQLISLDLSANTALYLLCCGGNLFTCSELIDMFRTLHSFGGAISYGRLDCDLSIAEEKGWAFGPIGGHWSVNRLEELNMHLINYKSNKKERNDKE